MGGHLTSAAWSRDVRVGLSALPVAPVAMGGNVSKREVSINEEEELEGRMPRSATLPMGFKGIGDKKNWSATLPRGLHLDTSFNKLRKPKQDTKSLEEKQKDETSKENQPVEDLIKEMLAQIVEDSMMEKRLTKSGTLPVSFKGFGIQRNHTFGKRIRQSIRKMVDKTPRVGWKTGAGLQDVSEAEESKELVENLLSEILAALDLKVEGADACTAEEDAESQINNSVKENSDIRQSIQQSLKKIVTGKKYKKESLEMVKAIIDEMVAEIEGGKEMDAETLDEEKSSPNISPDTSF